MYQVASAWLEGVIVRTSPAESSFTFSRDRPSREIILNKSLHRRQNSNTDWVRLRGVNSIIDYTL